MVTLRHLRRRQLRVVVMGSGPAGLFAAWGAEQLGHTVEIYSRGVKSSMYGAQYLHTEIPGLDCGKMETIQYLLKGDAEAYRRKVYGDGYDGPVSPVTLFGLHSCWNIRRAYDHAWDRYADRIIPTNFNREFLAAWKLPEADRVIWSIPLAAQCINPSMHRFVSTEIWARGDAPDLAEYCPVTVAPFTVVTNGDDSPRWYRAANVYGHRTAEWPLNPKPPISGLARVVKPVSNDCACWVNLDGVPVLRVGRYGRWEKGQLSHNAYFQTREWLR